MILNTYQNQNSKNMELETKLRMQKMKYDKKLKNLEDLYLNQIDHLNKKIYFYEKTKNYNSYKKEKSSNGNICSLIEEEDFSRNVKK